MKRYVAMSELEPTRLWCRVVAELQSGMIDVMVADGEIWRIPVHRIPEDLRDANSEFFLAWNESSDPNDRFAIRLPDDWPNDDCQQTTY